VLFERVAGPDIGKATLTVCARTPGPRGRRTQPRTFSMMTRSLDARRDWLLAEGVTIAAMESTPYGRSVLAVAAASQNATSQKGCPAGSANRRKLAPPP
jgi:hypothetical protein